MAPWLLRYPRCPKRALQFSLIKLNLASHPLASSSYSRVTVSSVFCAQNIFFGPSVWGPVNGADSNYFQQFGHQLPFLLAPEPGQSILPVPVRVLRNWTRETCSAVPSRVSPLICCSHLLPLAFRDGGVNQLNFLSPEVTNSLSTARMSFTVKPLLIPVVNAPPLVV